MIHSFRLLLLLALFAVITSANAEPTPDPMPSPHTYVFAPVPPKQLLTFGLFEEADGTARFEKIRETELEKPSSVIVWHPGHERLYLVQGWGPMATLHPVEVDRATGEVTPGEGVSIGKGCAFLALDPLGQFLLPVSYNTGRVEVHPVTPEGKIGEALSSTFEEKNMAHSGVVSRDGQFVYIPYVKEHNALHQYRLDRETGALTPLDPPLAPLEEGIGPRHGRLHPSQPWIYFSNEQQLGVSAYRITESGALELIGVYEGPEGEIKNRATGSDLVITPDGRHLFVGVRNLRSEGPDEILCYAIGEDGTLTRKGAIPTDDVPWTLSLSEDGRYLFAVAHRGGSVSAYRVLQDGQLYESIGQIEIPPKTMNIEAVPGS